MPQHKLACIASYPMAAPSQCRRVMRSGPCVREALSKDRKKDSGGGEDQWLMKPANGWGLEGMEGERASVEWSWLVC